MSVNTDMFYEEDTSGIEHSFTYKYTFNFDPFVTWNIRLLFIL